jgi:uncharacterized protein (DUF305 family)
MTSRVWVILAIVAVVGVGAGVGIGAAAWAGDDHDENGTAMSTDDSGGHGGSMMDDGDSTASDTAALGERDFLEQMVPHHQSAIEMAELALDKAEHPEVRRLAQGIITAQDAEIGRMHAWHQQWFGEQLTPSASGPHASVDMSELEDATEDFDRVFLRMMIGHHASAITMAESVMMGEPREEIDTLASQIIAAQAKEVGQMQELRERWYPPLG